MSAYLPRKTWDRVFVAWLILSAVIAVLLSNWSAAMGWTAAAFGWWAQTVTSDLLEDALDLARRP